MADASSQGSGSINHNSCLFHFPLHVIHHEYDSKHLKVPPTPVRRQHFIDPCSLRLLLPGSKTCSSAAFERILHDTNRLKELQLRAETLQVEYRPKISIQPPRQSSRVAPSYLDTMGLTPNDVTILRRAVNKAQKLSQRLQQSLHSKLSGRIQRADAEWALACARREGLGVYIPVELLRDKESDDADRLIASVCARLRIDCAARLLGVPLEPAHPSEQCVDDRLLRRPQLAPLEATSSLQLTSKKARARRALRKARKPRPQLVDELRREFDAAEASQRALAAAVLADVQWAASHCSPKAKEVARTLELCKKWAAQKAWAAINRVCWRIERATFVRWRRIAALVSNASAVRRYARLAAAIDAIETMLKRIMGQKMHALDIWATQTRRLRALEHKGASLALQTRLWRPRLARNTVRRTIYAQSVSKIQRAVRRALAVKRVAGVRFRERQRRASQCICRAYRSRLICKVAKLTLVQRREERLAQNQNDASLLIQSAARGGLTRRKTARLRRNRARHSAARTVQTTMRTKLAHTEVRTLRRRQKATLSIQTAQRARVGHQRATILRRQRDTRYAGATVTRVARGWNGRRKARHRRRRESAATTIATAGRKRAAIVRTRIKRENAVCLRAVSCLQAAWRGHLGRQKAAAVRIKVFHQNRENGALRIQCCARQCRARDIVAKRREWKMNKARVEADRRETAASRIQAEARGRISRSQVAEKRHEVSRRELASIRLQSWQRSLVQQWCYLHLRNNERRREIERTRIRSAVTIQTRARVFNAERLFDRVRRVSALSEAKARLAAAMAALVVDDALQCLLEERWTHERHRAAVRIQTVSRAYMCRTASGVTASVITLSSSLEPDEAARRIQSKVRLLAATRVFKARSIALQKPVHVSRMNFAFEPDDAATRIQSKVRELLVRRAFKVCRNMKRDAAQPLVATSALEPDVAAKRLQSKVRSLADRRAFKERRIAYRSALQALLNASAEARDMVKDAEAAVAEDISIPLAHFASPPVVNDGPDVSACVDDVIADDIEAAATAIQKCVRRALDRACRMQPLCHEEMSCRVTNTAISCASMAVCATLKTVEEMSISLQATQSTIDSGLENLTSRYHACATKIQALHRRRAVKQRLARQCAYKLGFNKEKHAGVNEDDQPAELSPQKQSQGLKLDTDKFHDPSFPREAPVVSPVILLPAETKEDISKLANVLPHDARPQLSESDHAGTSQTRWLGSKEGSSMALTPAAKADNAVLMQRLQSDMPSPILGCDESDATQEQKMKTLAAKSDDSGRSAKPGSKAQRLHSQVAPLPAALAVQKQDAPIAQTSPSDNFAANLENKESCHVESEAKCWRQRSAAESPSSSSSKPAEKMVADLEVAAMALAEKVLVNKMAALDSRMSELAEREARLATLEASVEARLAAPESAIESPCSSSSREKATEFAALEAKAQVLAEKVVADKMAILEARMSELAEREARLANLEASVEARLAAQKSVLESPSSFSSRQNERVVADMEAAAKALAEKAVEDKIAAFESRMSELTDREARLVNLEAGLEARFAAAKSKEDERMTQLAEKIEQELTERAMKKLDEESRALQAKFANSALVVRQDQQAYESDDWIAYYDDATSANYYYNANTYETRWDLPLGAKARRGDTLTEGAMVDGQNDGLIFENIDEPDQGGWLEYWDESAGARYWYNTLTHEASWTPPQTLPAGVDGNVLGDPHSTSSSGANGGQQNQVPQDPNWSAIIDAKTGKEIWLHDLTGEVWRPGLT